MRFAGDPEAAVGALRHAGGFKSLRLRANNIDVAASAEGSVRSILMSTA